MQKTIHLDLPMGFRTVERTQTMHISRAEKLLLSKRRCDYIRAVRNGDEAQLTAKYYICPSCRMTGTCRFDKALYANRQVDDIRRRSACL